MSVVVTEIVVIFLLVLVNGAFAMTELAVVSSRKSRLRVMAAEGRAGARVALALAESPDRFLPSVQLGITLVGLLAGAFGGITLAEQIAGRLESVGGVAPYAEAIGVAVVVMGLTYLSLVIGELVPKRLALANPERVACRMAVPIDWLSRVTRPVIWLLGVSTDRVLQLIGARRERPATVSDEEIKLLLEEGVRAGVFHRAEPGMIESVLALDHRPVREIMTPRERMIFLPVDEPHAAFWKMIVTSGHSEFPVCRAGGDDVAGMVSVKAIYANLAAGVPVRLADLMVPPLLIEESRTVADLLEALRRTRRHGALVNDAAGRTIGMVTLVDVLETIVGELPAREARWNARRRQLPEPR